MLYIYSYITESVCYTALLLQLQLYILIDLCWCLGAPCHLSHTDVLYTEARARGGVGLTPGTPREHMLTWGHHRPPPGASPGHHRGLPIDHPGAARPQVGQITPLHAPRWGRAPEFTPPGGAVVCQARNSAHDGEHCGSDGAPRGPYAAHPAQCANSNKPH